MQLTSDHRQARLNSFEEDLNLTGNDFSVAVSILSVGSVLLSIVAPRRSKELTPPKLRPHANSQQHDINQSSTIVIHAFLGLRLVLHLSSHCWDD